ncbi:hypothetical protein [Vibrio splendidus]|uniref:hypothetical protein n=1 Tax=Vibrio splendidus TaxID=29497 RepID=UPI00037A4469|nr:hypothetical protein [Vibrio splendidus]OEE56063.1 hypothetical protein A146_07070 [Vibrio splendidus FF-500]
MEELEASMLKIMREFTADKTVPVSSSARNLIVQSTAQGLHTLADGFMLGERFQIFEPHDPYWISEIDFDIQMVGADIKLSIVDALGDVHVILPTSRSTYTHSETVKFKVGRAACLVSIVNGDANPVRLESFSLKGRNIGELVKIMKSARSTWKNLNEEYDNLREIIAPELAYEKAEISNLKNESAEIENRLVHLKQAIKLDEKQAKTVAKYLLDMEAKHNSITEQVNQLITEKATLSSSNNDLKNEIAEKATQRESIAIKLSETQEKLKTYKNEASLYSEDFSEYKSEINRQNTIYKTVLSVLLLAGTVLSVNMYFGASKLSSDLQFNFDIWSLLVSRLPIISLNIFLLGICSTVIYKMIELITKNNERLSLTKQVAYLVKECTDSQSDDLILDDEQILKSRISNKMLLIREFISSQNESDLEPLKSLDLDKKFRN